MLVLVLVLVRVMVMMMVMVAAGFHILHFTADHSAAHSSPPLIVMLCKEQCIGASNVKMEKSPLDRGGSIVLIY